MNKGSANQYPPQRRNIKNVVGMGSSSFAPTASHSRQRSPVIGGAGKDAKFFNATGNQAINISDKKHEILGGTTSFNISMNLIPMNSQHHQHDDDIGSHIVVKEEHNEEEDDEDEIKGSPDGKAPSIAQIPELNLRVNPNDTTVTSTALNATLVVAESLTKLSPEEIRQKCKDRMDESKKLRKKELPLSDQLDMRDPQNIAEMAQDVYDSMLEMEKEFLIDNEYLKKVQTEIKDTSRGFLVEWIIDVTRKFRLLPETLYVTVSIIDRYLSLVNIKKS